MQAQTPFQVNISLQDAWDRFYRKKAKRIRDDQRDGLEDLWRRGTAKIKLMAIHENLRDSHASKLPRHVAQHYIERLETVLVLSWKVAGAEQITIELLRIMSDLEADGGPKPGRRRKPSREAMIDVAHSFITFGLSRELAAHLAHECALAVDCEASTLGSITAGLTRLSNYSKGKK